LSDREDILEDKEFWTRLEYVASAWLQNSEDNSLRRYWVDGFLPETVTNTKRGVDVEGQAWVGEGARNQHTYRFVVSVPQKMLHCRRGSFSIEQLALDEANESLNLVVTGEGV
jgi:hypothetical protein